VQYLAKIAGVWENLLGFEAVLDHIISEQGRFVTLIFALGRVYRDCCLGDSVCVVVCGHLLCSSLALVNPNLREMQDELEDDIQLDSFADPHVRNLCLLYLPIVTNAVCLTGA
jgi:hypothetical protein